MGQVFFLKYYNVEDILKSILLIYVIIYVVYTVRYLFLFVFLELSSIFNYVLFLSIIWLLQQLLVDKSRKIWLVFIAAIRYSQGVDNCIFVKGGGGALFLNNFYEALEEGTVRSRHLRFKSSLYGPIRSAWKLIV